MKNLKRALVVLVALMAVAASASAQFRWGVKVGTDINKMSFDKSAFDSDNRTGFTGGLTAEFTLPLVGIGMDASLMYTHKVNNVSGTATDAQLTTYNSDFIEIPINLKYKLGLAGIGKIVTPYFFTGPSFGFLVSKKTINNIYKRKNSDISWNVGAGVQLFSHLQVSAAYGFGINKTVEVLGGDNKDFDAKSNTWTITAAYLF